VNEQERIELTKIRSNLLNAVKRTLVDLENQLVSISEAFKSVECGFNGIAEIDVRLGISNGESNEKSL
jgi:hypothetical protein